MSEFACVTACTNDPVDPLNSQYYEFQDCVQDVVGQNNCGETYTNCQTNFYNGCRPLVDTNTVTNCFNTNSVCQNLNTQPSGPQIYQCWLACLSGITSTNQGWNNMTQCLSYLGSSCYNQFNVCFADFAGCGVFLLKAELCA